MLTQFTPFIYNYRGIREMMTIYVECVSANYKNPQFLVGHQHFSAAIINAVATNTACFIRLSE